MLPVFTIRDGETSATQLIIQDTQIMLLVPLAGRIVTATVFVGDSQTLIETIPSLFLPNAVRLCLARVRVFKIKTWIGDPAVLADLTDV